MVGSNTSSGLGRPALCETLESRNHFSTTSSAGVDPAFRGGSVVTHFGGVDEVAQGVIVLKDGRALVSGFSTDKAGKDHNVFAMYNMDGTLSNRFDGDGKLILSDAVATKLNPSAGYGLGIRQIADGSILLEGNKSFAKLKLDGSVDTSFGKSGYVARTPPGTDGEERDVVLADGTLRDVSYVNGVLRVQDLDAKGRVTISIRRTVNVDGRIVGIDASGLLLADPTHLYRYKADLTKYSSFGTGGVLDLTPAFQKWAAAHGPFGDSLSSDQTPIVPTFDIGGTFAAKSGYGIVGYSSETSPNANTSYPRGEGDAYTQVIFSVSSDGKTVLVDSGDVNGKLLAKTQAAPYSSGGGGESSYGFYTEFTKTDNTIKTLLLFPDDIYAGANGAAEAADVSFYVVGQHYANNDGYGSEFVVAHTTVI